MTATQTHPWLDRFYLAALMVHGAVLAVLAMVAVWVMFGTRLADSAPDLGFGAFLVKAIQVLWLVPLAVIPTIVFLSRRFAWRLGHVPSSGHKGLAVAGALPFLGMLLWAVLQ